MSWFARNTGDADRRAAYQRLRQVVTELGLIKLLEDACGKRGLRRFILRFEARGATVRAAGLDSERLPNGGPPDPDAMARRMGDIERAMAKLRQRMPPPFDFERCALVVIRDDTGQLDLSFRFDEDAERLSLASVRKPIGEGVPVEDAQYLRALEEWSSRMLTLRGHWMIAPADATWSLENGVLSIQEPGASRRLAAEAIATWQMETGDFSWVTERRIGPEAPFGVSNQKLETARAAELAVFACARMGFTGIFQGGLEQPALVLLAGIKV